VGVVKLFQPPKETGPKCHGVITLSLKG